MKSNSVILQYSISRYLSSFHNFISEYQKFSLIHKIVLVLLAILTFAVLLYYLRKLASVIYYQGIRKKFKDLALCTGVLIFFVIFSSLIFYECLNLKYLSLKLVFKNLIFFLIKNCVVGIFTYLILVFHELFLKSFIVIDLAIISFIVSSRIHKRIHESQLLVFIFILSLGISIMGIFYKSVIRPIFEKIIKITLFMSRNIYKFLFFCILTSAFAAAFVSPAFQTLINLNYTQNNLFIFAILGFYILWLTNFIYSINSFFCSVMNYNEMKGEQFRNYSFMELCKFCLKSILYRSLFPIYLSYFILILNGKVINFWKIFRKLSGSIVSNFIILFESFLRFCGMLIKYQLNEVRDHNLVFSFDAGFNTCEDIYIGSIFTLSDFIKLAIHKAVIYFPMTYILLNSRRIADYFQFDLSGIFNFSNWFFFFILTTFIYNIGILYPKKESTQFSISDFDLGEPTKGRWHVRGRVYFTI